MSSVAYIENIIDFVNILFITYITALMSQIPSLFCMSNLLTLFNSLMWILVPVWLQQLASEAETNNITLISYISLSNRNSFFFFFSNGIDKRCCKILSNDHHFWLSVFYKVTVNASLAFPQTVCQEIKTNASTCSWTWFYWTIL